MGSNGVRLVVGQLSPQGLSTIHLRKRVPVCFGQEVFEYGEFRHQSFEQAQQLFSDFCQIMHQESVEQCLCVATSAFREAKNSAQLTQEITGAFNLFINILDGSAESALIVRGVSQQLPLAHRHHLLIDIGGGSTEITLARGEDVVKAISIEVGTRRLLQRGKSPQQWQEPLKALSNSVKRRIFSHFTPQVSKDLQFIGTGGNLRCLGKLKKTLLDKDNTSCLKHKHFQLIFPQLMATTYQQRIQQWDLKPDRAEVIIPACYILNACLGELEQWPEIQLPPGGLADGAFSLLAQDPSPLTISRLAP